MLSKTSEHKSPRHWLAFLPALAVMLTLWGPLTEPSAFAAEKPYCSGGAIQIVAHQDDDLLFLSPDLLRDIDQGRCVRTVYVTAGDGGYDDDYWQSRERGSEAAWADMAGVADVWTTGTLSLAGHSVHVRTLDESPNVSLVFMRLPDGFPLGTGSAAHGYQSLPRLLSGEIPELSAVDGSGSYSASTLRDALLDAIRGDQRTWIRTQDYVSNYGADADHYDHHAVGFVTRDAANAYGDDHILSSYLGYGDFVLSEDWPQNVFGADLDRKVSAFSVYSQYDGAIDWDGYWNTGWLRRQYVLSTDGSPVAANAGPDQTTTIGSGVQLDARGSSGVTELSYAWRQTAGTTVDLTGADTATATFVPTSTGTYTFELTVSDGQASSTDTVTITVTNPSSTPTNIARRPGVSVTQSSDVPGQEGLKAIDGIADGYPNSPTNEWSSDGDRTDAWIKLTWDTPVTLNKVILHDRPNSNDQITAGTLVFSDGSTVPVPALANNGTATEITFPDRVVTSVQLKVTAVSTTTERAGLAEFEAWGTTGGTPTNQPPTANAGQDQTAPTDATVTLNGTASTDPNPDDNLTYAWRQTAGTTVDLTGADTATATFVPTSTGTYTFELTVSDGQASSTDTVTITVTNPSSTPTNIARRPGVSVTQSSDVPGQEGLKAIDGIADGYPNSPTNEWSSDGDRTDAWIKLTWDTPVTLNKVILHDRPNSNDQITAGTLVFSDGSTVPVPALANNGTATEITFPDRVVTSVQLKVTAVSTTTERAGLAEFEAWGTTGGTPTNQPPTANAGQDQTAPTDAVPSSPASTPASSRTDR